MKKLEQEVSRIDLTRNFVIQNWMRNKDTIDYLGLWEEI